MRTKFVLVTMFAVLFGALAFVKPASAAPDRTPCVDDSEACLQIPTTPLNCTHDPDSHGDCDLAIDKQVSVNGGAYADADTSDAAANAVVGDTVVWKVIVTNTDPTFTPLGTVYISDILPSGLTYNSHVASDGDYHPSDGSFFENKWWLPLAHMDGDSLVTNLPATLTINTTITSVGLIKNTAAITNYDPGSCDGGGCIFGDDDGDNNSNDAYINVSAKPVVLGESSTTPQVLALTDTGSDTTASALAALLVVSAIAVAGYGRVYARKTNR